ncbi:hypothetical protein CEXT_80521 [Caerostris extrusa]|uniref:Uncharacterized protein n=1 Tax=Caerostris extrusa TaxID=172846 RepID=A0AAV4TGH8_CAEEX|nr:hypothetical protein CEXT_80521 [Caerostris extrusa]
MTITPIHRYGDLWPSPISIDTEDLGPSPISIDMDHLYVFHIHSQARGETSAQLRGRGRGGRGGGEAGLPG